MPSLPLRKAPMLPLPDSATPSDSPQPQAQPYLPPERSRLDPSIRQQHPSLLKYKSWSPDTDRDETWLRRKTLHNERRRDDGARRLSRSVTDEDLDELRGCIDLGFGFDDVDVRSDGGLSRLAEAFPALDLYCAVNRAELTAGDCFRVSDSSSSAESGSPICYSPGESPHKVKARLKQWAQVVACSVRQRR